MNKANLSKLRLMSRLARLKLMKISTQPILVWLIIRVLQVRLRVSRAVILLLGIHGRRPRRLPVNSLKSCHLRDQPVVYLLKTADQVMQSANLIFGLAGLGVRAMRIQLYLTVLMLAIGIMRTVNAKLKLSITLRLTPWSQTAYKPQ